MDYWRRLEPTVELTPSVNITLTFEGDGTLTPAGARVLATTLLLGGTLTPVGNLTANDTILLTLAGTLTPTGSLDRAVDRTFSGTLTAVGKLVKATTLVAFEGTLTPTGSLDIAFPVEVSRVSQVVVEGGQIVDSPFVRTSQVVVEAAFADDNVFARVSQVVVEVGIASAAIPASFAPCGPLTVPIRSWINLYNTSGTLVAVFDDWKTLEVTHTLNSYSVCVLTMDGLDPRVPSFVLDGFVQVMRSIGGVAYQEYVGFHRFLSKQLTEDQHSIYNSTSRGLLDLVHRRFVYYQAVTEFTLKRDAGETVIKQIVNENVGPGAYAPPRFQSGITTGLTIAPDLGLGAQWVGQIANDNVLDVIGAIATLTGVDYDVVLRQLVPPAFEFRTYWPQRGTDRSQYLAFAPELGNMVAPQYTLSNEDEVNVVAVLGPGQDSSRRVVPMQGTDIGASPWNQVEGTVDASDQDTYEGMVAAGQTALNANVPKETFDFDVLQGDNIIYGRDYAVGDVVTARFGDVTRRKKIVGAVLGVREGVESIKLTFSDLP